jgi:hypothetical protein
MDLYVFADERKRVLERWDYLAIAAVPYAHGRGLYEDLQRERKRAGFHGEMKFARLHKKGIGSRVDTAKGWLRLVVDDARCANRRLFISITGIDNSQLDFHLFGPNGSPTASYANVYNRFFRASLLGLLNYCFPSQAISVRDVFHDSEGNLQNHKYFEWRVIQEISRREPRISFQKDKVTFVRSDPRLEKAHPRGVRNSAARGSYLGNCHVCDPYHKQIEQRTARMRETGPTMDNRNTERSICGPRQVRSA